MGAAVRLLLAAVCLLLRPLWARLSSFLWAAEPTVVGEGLAPLLFVCLWLPSSMLFCSEQVLAWTCLGHLVASALGARCSPCFAKLSALARKNSFCAGQVDDAPLKSGASPCRVLVIGFALLVFLLCPDAVSIFCRFLERSSFLCAVSVRRPAVRLLSPASSPSLLWSRSWVAVGMTRSRSLVVCWDASALSPLTVCTLCDFMGRMYAHRSGRGRLRQLITRGVGSLALGRRPTCLPSPALV